MILKPERKFKNYEGLKTVNCFRCKDEHPERDMIRLELKTPTPGAITGGDLLLICKDCHNSQGK